MAYYGTQDKCKACDKTVYVMDLMTADGVSYHKTCFKCSHCNGILALTNFSSMDGVLYCKPHFEQLFKETGNFNKNFQSCGKSTEKPYEMFNIANKISQFFSGTQEKCSACQKTVYPLEKVTVEGLFYHKPCFKCAKGGCTLTPSSYAALGGNLYCKPHFAQLFKEKGRYSHVIRATKTKSSSTTTPEMIEEDHTDDQPEDEQT